MNQILNIYICLLSVTVWGCRISRIGNGSATVSFVFKSIKLLSVSDTLFLYMLRCSVFYCGFVLESAMVGS